MELISRLRFDALAGYSRAPTAHMFNAELAWLEHDGERLLGVIVQDRVDGDFACVVFGRDEYKRFRCINLSPYFGEVKEAFLALSVLFHREKKDSLFPQEESHKPLDFFKKEAPDEKLHQYFKLLTTEKKYSPAVDLLRSMMHYFEDPDGNFVKDFQTDNFDSRLWELYLFAAFTEQNYGFDRQYQAPDFYCKGVYGSFFVEAVTVNPSQTQPETGPPKNASELQEYLHNYIPIKYGSPLFSKLNKKYWEKAHIKGKPIIFAIQDFHFPGSMTYSEVELAPYLFGRRQNAALNDKGEKTISSSKIEYHKWKEKEIPSGFFFQPNAEHVSAVLTNSQATMIKFNRMGMKAGFGDLSIKGIRLFRCWNPDPLAIDTLNFMQDIHDENYEETWSEGMNVYHNPKAISPLPDYFLPAAVHHRIKENLLVSRGPALRVISSTTQFGVTVKEAKEQGINLSANFPFSAEERSFYSIPEISTAHYETDSDYLNDRGSYFYKKKLYKEALKDLSKAIELAPNNSNAYFNRSLVYGSLGKHKFARKDLEKLIVLSPEDAHAHALLGLCCEKNNQFQESMIAYTTSIALAPERAESYLWRAQLHHRMRNFDLAVTDLTTAIDLSPDCHEAYFNRAQAQICMKANSDAKRDFEAFLSKVATSSTEDPAVLHAIREAERQLKKL